MEEQFDLPDTTEEEEQVVSLEAIALDIESFLAQVSETGGVSRGMAEKAAHLLPVDTNYAYYSQTPTKTQLKVTLEAIDLKTALLIAGAVVAVAVLAIKIVQYLRDSRKKLEQSFAEMGKFETSISHCFKLCDRITKNLNKEALLQVKDIEKELSKMAHDKISEYYSPVIHDAVVGGKWSTALVDASKTADEIFGSLEQSINVLEQLTLGKVTTVDTKVIVDPTDMKLPKLLTSIYRSSADQAGTAMSEIGQDLSKAHGVKVGFKESFEDFFSKHSKNMGTRSKLSGKGTWKVEAMEKTLVKLEKKVANKRDLDPELRRELNQVSNSIRAGVQQLMSYQRMVIIMATGSRNFWYLFEKYAAAKLKFISALAVQSDDPEVKKVLLEASKIKTS